MKRLGGVVSTLVFGAWACSHGFAPDAPGVTAATTSIGAGGATHASSAASGMGGSGGAMMQTDLYVDAAQGMDQNAGTFDKPLKTVKEAVKRWKAGQTVILKAGTYSPASNETWGYDLPDGIVIKSNSDGVVLKGPADLAFTSKGTASVEHVAFDGFKTAIDAGTGPLTFKGVKFSSDDVALNAHGMGNVSLVESCAFADTAVAANAKESAQVAMTDVTIMNAPAPGATNVFINAAGSAKITLKNITAKAVDRTFLTLTESATGSVDSADITAAADAEEVVAALGNTTLSLTSVKLTDAGTLTEGLFVSASAKVTAHGFSVVGGGAYGVRQSGGTLIMDGSGGGSKITDQFIGLYLNSGGATVTGIDIESNSTGIEADMGLFPQLKVRGCTIAYNSVVGVAAYGDLIYADLGKLMDDGKNIFKGSPLAVKMIPGGQLGFIMDAVGNTWIPNAQGADGTGHYPANTTKTGPQNGPNFAFPGGYQMNL